MAANNFQIVISAKDTASAVVSRVTSALGKAAKPLSRIGSAIDKAAASSGLDQLEKGVAGIARSAMDTARNLGTLGGTMGLVTGAGSIAGVAALVNHWGQVGVSTANAANGIGIAAGRLRTLQHAAGLAGLSADDMTGSLRALGTTLQDAAFGRNNEAAAMMNTLGITMRRTASGAVDVEAALADIAAAIAKQTNPQTQARIAQMFGVEALLPMLRKGRAGWQAYIAEIDRLAAVDERTQRQSEDLGTSLNRLKAAVSGVGTTIEADYSNKLGPTIDKVTRWIAANKETSASITEIGGVLGGVAAAAMWNPIVAGVAALAGGAALIYKNWDDIDGFFRKKFAEIDKALHESDWWKRTSGDVPKENRDAYWWTFGLFGPGGFLYDTNSGGAAAAVPNAAPSVATPPAATPTAPPAAGTASRLPLGIRQNNPGNLRTQGTAGMANGFAVYRTPEEGLAAAARNLIAYQDKHGINTISGVARRWASGPTDNPAAYAANVERMSGINRDQPLNMRDAKTLAPLLSAMIRQENGQNPYSQQQVEQAVKVTIEMAGEPPQGTRVTAQNANGTGGAAPRVEYAMPSFASP